MLHTLSGFQDNEKYGKSSNFDFILSNGDRSKKKVKGQTYIDRMIPEGAPNKIRSVTIYHAYEIIGFSFFDKDELPIFKIGKTDACWNNEKVEIAENEVTVKLLSVY